MQVHVLQHVEFEGLGSIAAWCQARGAAVEWTRFQRGQSLSGVPGVPGGAGADLVIVLGGPMSVNDEAALPWLRQERAFLAARLRAGRPTLGICLGAQAMAAALGAAVRPNAQREIGWFDIHAEAAAGQAGGAGGADCVGVAGEVGVTGAGAAGGAGCTFKKIPASLRVFHWHGETFELPAGTVRLASSAACINQAFQYGRRAIGLQFHLETTPASAAALVEHAGDDLAAGGPWVQDAATILSATPGDYARIHALMGDILDYLVG